MSIKTVLGLRNSQENSRDSLSDASFYIPDDLISSINPTMKQFDSTILQQQRRRQQVRIDQQDGPWSLSVADTPHQPYSFTIYIKTSTHNITLTRSTNEILQLHQKLHDSFPGVKFPPLPVDITSRPPKRKSNFLNTLSRLASPTSAKSNRHHPRRPTTPLASPSTDALDPFTVGPESSTTLPLKRIINGVNAQATTNNSSSASGLAAYLTTIANMNGVRQARVWKRFVRVRTDDLESVRVERAIKRRRSDLASHLHTQPDPDLDDAIAPEDKPVPPVDEPVETALDDGIPPSLEEDAAIARAAIEDLAVDTIPAAITTAADTDTDTPVPPPDAITANDAPPPSSSSSSSSTPADHPDLPPTPSADPDAEADADADAYNTSRTSLSYASSQNINNLTPTSSHAGGDDSSISTSSKRRAKKKRSMSTDPGRASSKRRPSATTTTTTTSSPQRKVVIDDFEMMRVLGKGCAGKVLLVRHKSSAELYALKAITKRHVLAHQELQHTLTEQAVLRRMAAEARDPFVVRLWWSFHDKENLFLVMDFHPGGDLATQLARWGRLGRDRARFYAAEIVEGVEGLHAAGVIYRDLKPENILIGADGHIVLTDFGLSKEFSRANVGTSSSSNSSNTTTTNTGGFRSEFYASVPGTPQPWTRTERGGVEVGGARGGGHGVHGVKDSTSTFCGTAEYLAPEVIQGMPYSYEVDWWSFGTMLYEMLTGITPFWANNHSDMYVRVLQDELQFPDDRGIDQDTKSLIRGLLQRNPVLRICEPRIKRHPYFSMIDWSHVYFKRYIPPYIPPIDPSNASDTQNFDDTFLDMEPVLDDFNEQMDTDAERGEQTDTDRTDGDESGTTPSQSRSSSVNPRQGQGSMQLQMQQSQQQQQQQQQLPTQQQMEMQLVDDGVDVFDGYSFKGRSSVLIDEEGEEGEEGSEEEEVEEGEVEEEGSRDGLEREHELEQVVEPKTPEARSSVLPEPEADAQPEVGAELQLEVEPGFVEEVEATPMREEEETPPSIIDVGPEIESASVDADITEVMQVSRKSVDLAPPPPPPPPPPAEEVEISTPVPVFDVPASIVRETKSKTPTKGGAVDLATRLALGYKTRTRREKSGVPALDRYLSDAVDGEATEREEEDDDWDIVEAADGEDRNGSVGIGKGSNSLFARGVVDRYRLAVFRKASTPSRRAARRVGSGSEVVAAGDLGESSSTASASAASPTPVEKQRRGRNPGLTFRKSPRQFLRARSPIPVVPPPSLSASHHSSASNNNNYGSMSSTAIATMAAASTSAGLLLTPSPSTAGQGASPPPPPQPLVGSPSLKSKESALSVGAQSLSSDLDLVSPLPTPLATPAAGTGNGDATTNGHQEQRSTTDALVRNVFVSEELEKPKTKKLKKYKENAEKVFSLFSGGTPRQPS